MSDNTPSNSGESLSKKEVELMIAAHDKRSPRGFVAWLVGGSVLIICIAVMCSYLIASGSPTVEKKSLEALESSLAETDTATRRLLRSSEMGLRKDSKPSQAEITSLLDETKSALDSRASANKLLLGELKSKASTGSDAVVPYANLLTGGLIVGLLGFLGLNRLSQIDQEVKGIRDSLLKEISDRIGLSEEASTAKILSGVQSSLDEARDAMESSTSTAQEKITENVSTSEKMLLSATNTLAELRSELEILRSEVAELPNRYPFLNSAEKRELIEKIEQVESVEQMHSLAAALHHSGEEASAIKALEQIIHRRLSGSPTSFHNAHSQAMQMGATRLGFELAKFGQSLFPRNSDAAADTVRGHTACGEPDKAIEFGESWLRSNKLVARSWTFVVFLVQAYESQGMSPETRDRAVELLEEEVSILPKEPKVWSALAQLYRSFDPWKAFEALERGLEACPTSQELKFVKAQYLLADGRPIEAKTVLESSIESDFQDQFQSDVNGAAVQCFYAQAAEALGERDRARLAYKHAFNHKRCHTLMKMFIIERLGMLDLIDGVPPAEKSNSVLAQLQQLVNESGGI